MPYRDPEQQRAAESASARRRRAHKAAGPVYVAGRDLTTSTGPRLAGEVVDVSGWTPRQVEMSLAVGELRIPTAPGRTAYVAAVRLRVADGWLEPGDPVPDAQFMRGRLGPRPYLEMGQIVPNPLASVPM